MGKQLIFVSCGQCTSEERALGSVLKSVIDGTPGFAAYFADVVQNFDALGHNVLDALRRCSGAVVILHARGPIMSADGEELGHRSSVWINQEVAILAYRQFVEDRTIPVLAFTAPGVMLEGAMTALILNPRSLPGIDEVIDAVKVWLASEHFAGLSESAFIAKWDRLSEQTRMVVAALIEEGGRKVKDIPLFHALNRLFGMDANTASKALLDAKQQFAITDLAKLNRDLNSGEELSINPTWEFDLRRQVSKWRAGRESSAGVP